MSKPLVLTVYPKDPTYEPSDAFTVYLLGDGKKQCAGTSCELPSKKRLTDAELAAEVFSAVFHEAECEVRGMRIERGFPPRPGHPAVENYVKLNHEFGRQAGILERFATLPHYDEVTA